MFEITSSDEKSFARTGILKTLHGKIETPFFMPVATKTAVKFLDIQELRELGCECFISNSLVLFMRPGLEVMEKFGGIHKFCNWDKGVFTDSGGFQTGSKSFLEKITDTGVHFKNPFDGTKHLIQAEDVIKINEILRPDVVMVLDDMPLPSYTKERVIESTNRTLAWAERAKNSHKLEGQLLFGIAQGGFYPELRQKSIEKLTELNFDGIALGGLAIGEPPEETKKIVDFCAKILPKKLPHYLLGVGTPLELLNSIEKGIDCFDSRFPTKSARHG
ncbi:MAG: tRNA guanosine(34) transglycosylase Tgt, partial [Candidatus Diapherotrites archaeon]|nr:tRNA guanosine(34) transglycosylase Tgt [Candidatus Diapherotrites archaeon]